MSWRLVHTVIVLAIAAVQSAHAACPTLTVDFFPPDTENVPEGWTKAAQVAAGNEDSSSLNTILLTAKPTPKLYVQPVHPFFQKRECIPADCLPSKPGRRLTSSSSSSDSDCGSSGKGFESGLHMAFVSSSSSSSARILQQACLTTVAAPAAYDIVYNIDGGIDKKATMPLTSPPYISLTTLDTLAPGTHTLNIKVTMLKGSAEVNSVASLQPAADQEFTTKVLFNLVDELPTATAPAAAAADTAKTAGVAAAAGKAAAAAEVPVAAAEAPAGPKPGIGGKNVTDALADNPVPEPAIDETVTQQAVKYYCTRQYNVGGKIHSQKEVPAGDEGIMACAVACNALGSNCAGFGLTGKKCFLMQTFNTNSSAADATIDALCMKSPNDWLDFGVRNAGNVGSGFFCLRGYDMKGDPAGSGDADNPVQTANTEIAGMTPSTCATQCKSTVGCQFMLMKKPATPGGTATCFLKMHALGGLYGNTGPATDVDYTCFNGQDAWMTYGGQLDYALPSPEVNTGVETPAVAAIGAIGVPTSGKTYRCIKQYTVGGTPLEKVQVSLGDEGLTQCAAKCDEQKGACVAFTMSETGSCTMLKTINFNTSASDVATYGLCFASQADWNKFGNPDETGMYCVKNYDFAGDGVRTVDYITIATGSAAVNFCKQQCTAEPQCQYSVTSLGKCYMKNNILSGTFGTTRADRAVDATCVKGESNWQLAALQVAASTGNEGSPRVGNMTARRSSMVTSAAGGAVQPLSPLSLMVSLCAGVLGLIL